MLLIWFLFNISLILQSKFECFLNKNESYQRFGAWAILLVFQTGWFLGTLHQILHHGHNVSLECSASHDPNATHLHDESYANEHCSLCVFVSSTPELLTISGIIFSSITHHDSKDAFHCTPSCTRTFYDTTCLRGPPVL